jgi:electron transport complex protein RnfD
MRFKTVTSPHILQQTSVGQVMRRVLYAMIPGMVALVWFFGWGILINLVLATAVALGTEAVMLTARGKPLAVHLGDYSAVVTAWLLAVALPPLAPWWLTVIGILAAIVVAKHLYGGLGYNPFNPAMIGYVVLLISFPRDMSAWLIPHGIGQPDALSLLDTLNLIFGGIGSLPIDALTGATPLDVLRTKLGLGQTVAEIRNSPVFGIVAGRGWEWATTGFLLGGLWLVYTRTAAWQIPAGLLVVGVSRQERVVVLQNNQVAIAAKPATGINHLAIGRCKHRVASCATNVYALAVFGFVKSSNNGALGRPSKAHVVFT